MEGNRTHSLSPELDFESSASTSSATPACACLIAAKLQLANGKTDDFGSGARAKHKPLVPLLVPSLSGCPIRLVERDCFSSAAVHWPCRLYADRVGVSDAKVSLSSGRDGE